MARGILSEFGPDSPKSQARRASSGGVKQARDVMGYSPPCGPANIGDSKGPGLHGDNYGVTGTQGKYDIDCGESGSPSLGGENRGMGTNRKG